LSGADAVALLRSLSVFADVDEELLRQVAAESEPVSLAAGEWLFHQGDEARCAYVIASGRVEVVDPTSRAVVRVLRRGAPLGEIALLRGGTRSASVRARRDTTLLALHRRQFDDLLATSPPFMTALMKAVGDHLASSLAPAGGTPAPQTIAVLPLGAGVDGGPAAEALAAGLRRFDPTEFFGAAPDGDARAWLSRLGAAEASHHRVVLSSAACDPGDAWTAFCAREADLIVALASGDPHPGWWARGDVLRDCELVVVGGPADDRLVDGFEPRLVRSVAGAAQLRQEMGALARRAAGRSVGVVLSGGGARALAHLGVIEELQRSGIPIDRIAGVSLGSLVAAAVARDPSATDLASLFHGYFVAQNPTTDYTVPLVSLIRGRKTARLIAEAFGEVRIEELALPYFCTSADLLRREVVVHRSGPLAPSILASLSIPGFFPPVRDRQGRLVVDGGLIDNLPVGLMAAVHEGPIIAVDVSEVWDTAPGRNSGAVRHSTRRSLPGLRRAVTGTAGDLPALSETIVRCMMFASADTAAAARDHAQLVIRPEVSGIGLLDWRRLPEMRAAGIAAARKALQEKPEFVAGLDRHRP
jgi:predicted acylesterase/phospholipase RssA